MRKHLFDFLPRHRLGAIVVALLAVLTSAHAQTVDGTIQLKDSFEASISSPSDVDIVEFEGLAGESVTLVAAAVKKSTLRPSIHLLSAGSPDVLATADAAKKKASLKKVILPATGVYRVEISGLDDTIGAFRLTTKGVPSKASGKPVAEPSGTSSVATFDAKPGAVFTATVSAAKGSDALPAPPLLTGPSGVIDLAAFTTTNSSGKKLKVKKVELPDFGAYSFAIDAVEGDGSTLNVKLKVKSPKSKKTKFVEPPEVTSTPPALDVLASLTSDESLVVSGGGVPPNITVRVDGGAQSVETTADKKGDFNVSVPLALNSTQKLFVAAVGEGSKVSPSAVWEVTHDSTPPVVMIDFPPAGAILTTGTVNVSGIVSDKLSGFMGLEVRVGNKQAAVDVGIGTNGTFDLSGVSLGSGGPVQLTATATDVLGNSASDTISVVFNPPSGASLDVIAGGDQSGVVGSELAEPLTVRLSTVGGAPLMGKPVTFEVIKSDGRLAEVAEGGGAMTLTTLTDELGAARAHWSLGSDTGMGNNRVRITSSTTSGAVFACASATPDLSGLKINIGNAALQVAQAGTTAPDRLEVWVNDGQNPLAGFPVVFDVIGGGTVALDDVGSAVGSTSLEVFTDVTGHAEVRYIAGSEEEVARIEARVPGTFGQPAVFQVRTIAPDEQGTRVSGVVRDNALQGVGGADVFLVFDGNAANITTTTDEFGRFEFDDVGLSGPAHVIVEGDTATTLAGNPINSAELTFPELAQEIFVVSEAGNELPRAILLPSIDPDSKVNYDGTEDIVLTVSTIEGIAVTVPAGTTVTKTDGSTVGPGNSIDLSISPVHVDDIPMPLPDGARAPFAWTLQPGGTTFDPPLPIELPNMAGLPAGAAAYILVFDHDSGRFEIVAPAEVSNDGGLIASLAGSGIGEAGWGGFCPPYPDTGETDDDCSGPDCCTNNQAAKEDAEDVAQAMISAELSLAAAEKSLQEAQVGAGSWVNLIGGGLGLGAAGTALALCPKTGGGGCLAAGALGLAAGIANLTAWFLGLPDIEELVGDARASLDLARNSLQLAKSNLEQIESVACEKGSGPSFDDQVKAVQDLLDKVNFVDGLLSDLDTDRDAAADKLQETLDKADEVNGLLCADFGLNCPGPFPILADGDSELSLELLVALQELVVLAGEVEALADAGAQSEQEMLVEFAALTDEADEVADLLDGASCVVTAAGITTTVDGVLGGFVLQNLPVNGGCPTRVTAVCETPDGPLFAASPYFQVVDQGTVTIEPLVFSAEPLVETISLSVSTSTATLTTLGQSIGIVVIGSFSDGSSALVAGFDDGLCYTSSAPGIVSVNGDGVATAVSKGAAFITVAKDGNAATLKLTVAPGDPLTIVAGSVVDAFGAPVTDASVTTTAGFAATSQADGSFAVADHTTSVNPLRVDATLGALFGFSLANPIVEGGTTTVGSIVVDIDGDGDQLPDWYETNVYGSDPSLTDTDGDGLTDNVEVLVLGSDPTLADTDGDGFDDALENALGSDLLVFDAATTLMGKVELPGRLPAAGAEVSVQGVPAVIFQAKADGAGFFTFDAHWPSGVSPVTLRATADMEGEGSFAGFSDPTVTIPGGVTFVGPFELSPKASGPLFLGALYATGSSPVSVAIGDLDGDGVSDLVVANFGSNDASVLLGVGDGTFTAAQSVAVGNSPRSVAIGDLDGDGVSDLAVANSGSNDVSVLLGVGDGTFAAEQSVEGGSAPGSVAIEDLNGDGVPDLAVANFSSNSVSVLLGAGNGTFTAAQSVAAGAGPVSVAIEDLDADGVPDLAVANFSSNDVSVLLGVGDGTFSSLQSFAAGDGPQSVAIEDLDGDGVPDLAVANRESNDVSVLLGAGDGTFVTAESIAAGAGPGSVAIEDLDGDDVPDLAVANFKASSSDVSVLLGVGDGTFVATQSVATKPTPQDVAIADVDGDGVSDLVVVSSLFSSEVSVHLGEGDGTFDAAQSVVAGNSPQSVAIRDLDGDGVLDLAVANAVFANLSVLLGAGEGAFGTAQNYATGNGPRSVAIADLDGDGMPDLAVANLESNDVSVLLGAGGGTFGTAQNFEAESAPRSLAIADFDGDGVFDLAVANQGSNDVSVLLGAGDGTYVAAESFAAGNGPRSVAVEDFDGDGVPDLAVANQGSSDVSVLLGAGDGTFGAAQSFAAGNSPSAVAITDLDADGVPDLAVTSLSGSVSVLLGAGDGTFATAQIFAAGIAPTSVAITDLDADGVPDLAVANATLSGTVSVLLGAGDGTFGAAQSFAAGATPTSVAIADLDADGVPDLVVTNQSSSDVTILINQLLK